MRYLLAGSLVLAFVACHQESKSTATATSGTVPIADARNVKIDTVLTQPPIFLDHANLGSQLNADGTVAQESAQFQQGEPIYLTLVLKESPEGLQTAAEWKNAKKTLRIDRQKMNGGKVVTFAMKDPKLPPGKYEVIGYWGENIAADKHFEIAAAAKKKK